MDIFLHRRRIKITRSRPCSYIIKQPPVVLSCQLHSLFSAGRARRGTEHISQRTGGTGYIGGTVLDTLVSKHPEYSIAVLLRNVPESFSKRYPNVSIIKGDFDSSEILSEAASNADVVIHGNSDHEPSIKALITGLLRRNGPSFLIQLGGTGVVADWQDPTYHCKLNPKVWSDIDDIDAITSLPDQALHRNVDKFIQEAAAANGEKLKTAIICPPDIYGPGRGPGKTQSVLLPVFYDETRKVGATFYAGEGKNTRSWVHIEDVTTVYLKLIEAAVAGGGGADWGREGYYFAASSEASQLDVAKAAGKILKAHGIIASAEPKPLPPQQVDGMVSVFGVPHIGTYLFAANSRTRADRARRVLGYHPKAPSLWDTMEADLMACAQIKA